MRKTCAQLVLNLCTQSVGKVPRKSVECISTAFYTLCTPSVRTHMHRIFTTFQSVILPLVPTVHTPYKEQKYLKLNLINTYISGELS